MCMPKGLRKTGAISSREEIKRVLAEISETVQRGEETRTSCSEKSEKTVSHYKFL